LSQISSPTMTMMMEKAAIWLKVIELPAVGSVAPFV
jgi:hypothetical protein